ncbi:DUF397 domain-containing protein [Fodinicola acaciae]|uniref:DUF397 domain-containing protein n=1 Tax=Fodinicola acaciae TaxID=2681555 RepID=UPI0013D74C9A|nr:DUF397 domain-containing protein [Fodinicola acaciae]
MIGPRPATTSGISWRKSSRSNGNGSSSCVQISDTLAGRTLVRDSKLGEASPVLVFAPAEWRTFVAGVRTIR